MMERERVNRPSSEIYVYATNKNFLNIYDALRIDKIKVEVTGYDPESRRQTGHASAWLDRADARLLTHLVAHRLFACTSLTVLLSVVVLPVPGPPVITVILWLNAV